MGVGYVGDGSGHQVDHLLPLGCIGLICPVNAQRLVQSQHHVPGQLLPGGIVSGHLGFGRSLDGVVVLFHPGLELAVNCFVVLAHGFQLGPGSCRFLCVAIPDGVIEAVILACGTAGHRVKTQFLTIFSLGYGIGDILAPLPCCGHQLSSISGWDSFHFHSVGNQCQSRFAHLFVMRRKLFLTHFTGIRPQQFVKSHGFRAQVIDGCQISHTHHVVCFAAHHIAHKPIQLGAIQWITHRAVCKQVCISFEQTPPGNVAVFVLFPVPAVEQKV